jgi:hypothetical protein
MPMRESARLMVGFSGFYESHKPPPLGDARGIVPPHRDGHLRFVCCHPGGRRGDTERVFSRWRRPVASGEALVMMHRVMCSVSHRRTAMAIEIARDEGAFICRPRLF